MLLISSSSFKPKLTFTKLTDHMEFLPIIAEWAEREWGYIRNRGVEYRTGVMNALKDCVYVGTFEGKPVAMFALLEYTIDYKLDLMLPDIEMEEQVIYLNQINGKIAYSMRARFDKVVTNKITNIDAPLEFNLVELNLLKAQILKFTSTQGHTLLQHRFHAHELMYVYVDKEYRGFGFGKQIIESAKQLAIELNSNVILLDTLKTKLNGFYKPADVVCEGRLFSQPTDVLMMQL